MSDLGILVEQLVQGVLGQLQETVHDAVLSALDDAGLVAPLPFKSKSGKRESETESLAKANTGSNGWEQVGEMPIKSGRVTHRTKPGYPCKVKGLGRSGTTGDGWTVVAITRKSANGSEWDYNVEVQKGRGTPSRIVKGDRIVYKRPKA